MNFKLKRILAAALLAPAHVWAADALMVNDAAEILEPSPEAFKAANEIASTPKFFGVLVDTSPTISYLSGQKIDFFATDAELKIAAGNALVYRASTIQDSNFFANQKSDTNCKIFFQCSEISGDASEGRRWWPFFNGVFASVGEQAKFMAGGSAYPEINNIIFYPNVGGTLVDGTQISSIWNVSNAALKPTTLRFNALDYEQSESGFYRWRIANWAARNCEPESGADVWEPEGAEDWTLASSGTPTFNADGSITFDASLERLYITPDGANMESGAIYIVSFDVKVESTSAYAGLYRGSGSTLRYNTQADIGDISVTGGGSFIRAYPRALGMWQKVRILLTTTSATKYYIYNGASTNVVHIRNFKLIKL